MENREQRQTHAEQLVQEGVISRVIRQVDARGPHFTMQPVKHTTGHRTHRLAHVQRPTQASLHRGQDTWRLGLKVILTSLGTPARAVVGFVITCLKKKNIKKDVL